MDRNFTIKSVGDGSACKRDTHQLWYYLIPIEICLDTEPLRPQELYRHVKVTNITREDISPRMYNFYQQEIFQNTRQKLTTAKSTEFTITWHGIRFSENVTFTLVQHKRNNFICIRLLVLCNSDCLFHSHFPWLLNYYFKYRTVNSSNIFWKFTKN